LASDRAAEHDRGRVGLAVALDLEALDLVEEPVRVGLVELDEARDGDHGDDGPDEHGEDRRPEHPVQHRSDRPGRLVLSPRSFNPVR
jgi:hypothetical protein